MIKRITLKGFKGHDGTFEFGPGVNKVKGPNEAGKSTLKDAINFVFWGTDALFSNSTDHLISNDQESCEVILETAKSVMARRKRRGQTAQFKASMGGAPFVEMTQTELETRILILDKDVFTGAWLAGHFMQIDGEARLQVFSKLAKLDRRELLLSQLPPGMTIPGKLKLEELAIDLSVVKTDRQALTKALSVDEGALNEVVIRINQLNQVANIDEAQVLSEISEISAQKEIMRKYEADMVKYEAYLARASEEKDRAHRNDTNRFEWLGIVNQADSEINAAAQGILEREQILAELRKKQETKPQEKKAFPAVPKKFSVSAGECPACLQPVTQDHVQHVAAAYEKFMMEYNQVCAEINAHNLNIDHELKNIWKEVDRITAEIKGLQEQKSQVSASLVSAQMNLRGLDQEEEVRKKLKKVTAPERPEGIAPLETLQSRFDELTLARSQYQLKIQSLDAQLARKQVLENFISSKKSQVDWLYQIEKKLEYLPTLEAEMAAKNLSLPEGKLLINKFKRKVNGQMIDRGELLVVDDKQVDYRALSSGRQLRMDIELCHKIRELAGPRSPKLMFVDNWDLMDREVRTIPGVQTLISVVDSKAKTLSIVSE